MGKINYSKYQEINIADLFKQLDEIPDLNIQQAILAVIERRFLQNIEARTKELDCSIIAVDKSINDLTKSSERMERLTKRLNYLTVVLTVLAAIAVIPIIRDLVRYF